MPTRSFLPDLLLALALLAAPRGAAVAQSGGVRLGTAGVPDASAVLDLRPDPAAPKGLLPPRLSQAQRDAIASPAAGLTVFNTTTQALNVWDGTTWRAYLPDATTVAFAYTGGPQTYSVPPGITRLRVELAGGSGGTNNRGAQGGLGGRVQAVLAVVPGEVLTLHVGGAGISPPLGRDDAGGGGGGATDLRQGGTDLSHRVLVAGGGGGSGSGGRYSSYGGCGGGLTACPGGGYKSVKGGSGGTQTGPGAGGTPNGVAGIGPAGGAGSGPAGGTNAGSSGGGGDGYYGGGSGGIGYIDDSGTIGHGAAGGGGSSYAGSGTSDVVHTPGAQAGNGYVRFTLLPANSPAPVLDASNFVNLPAPQALSLSGQALSLSRGGGTVTLPTFPGDNLGNHTATQNLDLGPYKLLGNGRRGLGISRTGTVTIDSLMGIGTASPAAQLEVALPAGSSDASLKLEQNGSNLIVRPYAAGSSKTIVENTAGSLLLESSGTCFVGLTDYRAPFKGSPAKLNVAGYAHSSTMARGMSLTSGGYGQYAWHHNLGYMPVLMLSIDGTGGQLSEEITCSYDNISENTTLIYAYNHSPNFFRSAEFIIRWIVVADIPFGARPARKQ